MDCGTIEREDLLLSNGHVGHCGAGVAGGFAGEVGTVSR